jgi:hypothetical protein
LKVLAAVTFAVTSASFACAASAQSTKRDIQGVSPGMTVAEVETVLGKKCNRPMGEVIFCDPAERSAFGLDLATNLTPQIVRKVRFDFCSGDQSAEVFQKVYSAYGLPVPPEPTRDTKKIGRDLTLSLDREGASNLSCPIHADTWSLSISDEMIRRKDEEAAQAKRREAAPTPKF